jgi:integrase
VLIALRFDPILPTMGRIDDDLQIDLVALEALVRSSPRQPSYQPTAPRSSTAPQTVRTPAATARSRRHSPARARAAAIAAGITTDRLHPKNGLQSLRHACASLHIEQGMSVKRAQTILGHSTAAMTLDIGHLFPVPDDDRAAMRQLQARLVG